MITDIGSTLTHEFNNTQPKSTANAGLDYATKNDALTFQPDETKKVVAVPVNSDNKDENDEGFVVNLLNANNATVEDGQGKGIIADADAAPPANADPTASDVRVDL